MDYIVKKWISFAYLPLFSSLLYLSLEIQNAPNIIQNLPVFIISCLLIYLLLLILFALTGKMFLSGFLVSYTLSTFYTVSFYRQMLTGQVLIPLTELKLLRLRAWPWT